MHSILNGSGLWGFDFEFKTGRIKDSSNDDENTPMYAEGNHSASAVHTPGDKSGRRYNYAIQFQADSGYAQITTHSNTHLLKRSGDLASSLEKKKISSWVRSAVKFGSRQKNQALPSGVTLSVFIKDPILPCSLLNSVNENFLVVFFFQNIIEKHYFSICFLPCYQGNSSFLQLEAKICS